MREFEIKVVGARKPRRRAGLLLWPIRTVGRVLRALLMRPRILVLAGAIAFATKVGTPHVGWDYECRYPMRPGHPCESVDYCAYYGIQGRRVVYPRDGETCQVIGFVPFDWQRVDWQWIEQKLIELLRTGGQLIGDQLRKGQ